MSYSANDSGPRWEDLLAVVLAIPLFFAVKFLFIFTVFKVVEVLVNAFAG